MKATRSSRHDTRVRESHLGKLLLPIACGIIIIVAALAMFSMPQIMDVANGLKASAKQAESQANAAIVDDAQAPPEWNNDESDGTSKSESNTSTVLPSPIVGPVMAQVPEKEEPQPDAQPQPQEQPQPSQGGGEHKTSGGGAPAKPRNTDGNTSGPYYAIPSPAIVSFNGNASSADGTSAIDFSSANRGVIGVYSNRPGKLKAQVLCGQASYNYPMKSGSSIEVPCNMGSGTYTVRVMLNTSGNRYAEIFRAEGQVALPSGTTPYTVPNLFCNYSANSACVAKARELAAGAQNQGDIVRSIYRWMSNNIKYDRGKAARASQLLDYVPNPDETLSSRKGVCFDYASLAGAMFRSLGIPCKVMTGYVSPGNLYHSWNMIYINGEWIAADISVRPGQWNRIDITFAASGSAPASSYSDKFTY